MLDFKPFQTVKISTVISYKYLKSLFFYSYFPIPPQQTHEALLQTDLVKLLEEVKNLELGIILFTGYQLNEIEDNLKSQCDIIIDGYFDEQKIDNDRALVGSLNQNINYISDRYTNEKDWFYNKKNLIEEINVGNDIIFNGDKI